MIRYKALPPSRLKTYVGVVGFAVLGMLYLLQKLYPKLAPLALLGLPLALFLRIYLARDLTIAGDSPVTNRVFGWLANIAAGLLILVCCAGYFLIASVARFSMPVVAVIATTLVLCVASGLIARRYISPNTWLAYGITFAGGIFLAVLMLYALGFSGNGFTHLG